MAVIMNKIEKTIDEKIEDARAELNRLEALKKAKSCIEGHSWISLGGCNAACDDDDCNCSIPVYTCSVCGECDYGENSEAAEIRRQCKMLREIGINTGA